MIDLQGIRHGQGRGGALAGVDLRIDAGLAGAVLGPASAGKSRLAAIAAARARPEAGAACILGCDAARLGRSALGRLRLKIGYAPQDPEFLEDEPLATNAAIGLYLKGASDGDVWAAGHAALEELGLADAADRLPRELSARERQRAAVARAVAGEPAVVVADDPVAGLDIDSAMLVVSALDRARQRGAALLVTSAEPRVLSAARFLGWRHYELRDGALSVPSARAPEAAAAATATHAEPDIEPAVEPGEPDIEPARELDHPGADLGSIAARQGALEPEAPAPGAAGGDVPGKGALAALEDAAGEEGDEWDEDTPVETPHWVSFPPEHAAGGAP